MIFPYPQTAGKERNIVTVDQSTFEGLPFRPTQTEAESLFTTGVYAANDWYGSPYELQYSQRANIEQSQAKAALVGGDTSGGTFASIIDIFGKVAEESFHTIADDFITTYYLQEQSRTAGSLVPGNPPAPGEINYTAADRERIIKEKIQAGIDAAKSFVGQIKGLFGMGYPASVEKNNQPIPTSTQKINLAIPAIVILILFMVTK